jgi:hypothetical protein
MTLTLINPATAAGSETLITRDFDNVLVHADALTAAEVVSIFVLGGQTATPYSESGAAVTLTATQPMRILPPGPTYRLDKGVTASACGVYASPKGSLA